MQQQFSTIVQFIRRAQINTLKVVNVELVNLYWNIGSYISSQVQDAKWGEKTVGELADYIAKNHSDLKGFNRRGLYRMRQFYESYVKSPFVSPSVAQIQSFDNQFDEIVSPLETQLRVNDIKKCILTEISWSHHLIILSRSKSLEEREFYIRLCMRERYSKRELERQINSGVFERSMLGAQVSPSLKASHTDISASFKDSYVFEFLNLTEPYRESDLQKGLIHQMKNFILELGRDFLFVGEEYKVQVGNSDFFIDLLFFHRGLQCLVAFELKADKFKPEHLGQLNFYLEVLDRDIKKGNENPSIGVLLCKDKDNEVVEYALSRSLSPTLVSEYKTQLPDKDVLREKLHELFQNEE